MQGEHVTPVSEINRGLDGVPAVQSAVSSIVGETLTYRGYDIETLVTHSSFEEVSYLLWHGALPTAPQLTAFKRELGVRRTLSAEVTETIGDIPPEADPMAALRTVVSSLALHDPLAEDNSFAANAQKSADLLAKVPTIVAAIHRARLRSRPIPPDPGLDTAANFLSMVHGKPAPPRWIRILDSVLVLYADHELNASTFAARVAASTRADLCSAVVAALATLKGSLHGGAGPRVMRLLEEIADAAEVDSYLDAALARGERIPGFGHRVYADGDPRARILQAHAAELARESGDARWYDLSRRLEVRMRERTGLRPNVDFYAASVYTYMGFPVSLFTPLFAVSRTSGWIAHILEQYDNNRLIRPRARYVGVGPRLYTQLDER